MRYAVQLTVCALLACALFFCLPAHADRQKAQQLFETGTQHYGQGRYDDAVTAFQAGFREEPLPDFLYNIGMAYQRSSRPNDAVRYFEMYALLTKDPKEREQARVQIASIQKEHSQAEGGKGGAFDFSGANPASSESKPLYKRGVFWVAITASVVAVAAATTLAVVLTRKDEPVLRLEQVP